VNTAPSSEGKKTACDSRGGGRGGGGRPGALAGGGCTVAKKRVDNPGELLSVLPLGKKEKSLAESRKERGKREGKRSRPPGPRKEGPKFRKSLLQSYVEGVVHS